ncbi:MAG: hypothetical protein KDH20_05645 [Rhodocyclaceae bacterium]|nr:hypothetical protein [Rhodocyclaceae bacterium]
MASSNNWILAGVVLAVFVGFLVYSQLGADADARLRASGKAAIAEVVSADQSGSWVNNNPVLDLALDVSLEGERYRATLRTMVPQVRLAMVQPGARLQLRVDPDDRGRVVIDEPWSR